MQPSQDGRLWVLIETGSNQDFIFQSNRQHFHVGASEILHRVGTWVSNAVAAVQRDNRDKVGAHGIDPIVVTSSKAMLLVDNPEDGRTIVETVTRQALVEAPGLELWGYVESSTTSDRAPMGRVSEAHSAHNAVRWQRPSAKLRFLTYPFSDICSRTGIAASERQQQLGTEGSPMESLSPVATAVRKASEGKTRTFLASLVEDQTVLGDRREEVVNAGWVAVVHIDGNGVGDVIRGIRDVETYRAFSVRLQDATREAFASACAIPETEGRTEWLLPLIVGGDDVTFVCDARVAIPVVRAYLTSFEQKTTGMPGLPDGGHLTAAAGLAAVKPHYPFHAAYQLAAQLAASAKKIKRPEWVEAVGRRSAYDFHVLHDSVTSPLSELRRGFEVSKVAGGPALWPPLFLAPPSIRDGRPPTPWEDEHLLDGVTAVLAPWDDEAPLSGSALHDLRAALLAGEGDQGRTLVRLRTNSKSTGRFDAFLKDHLAVTGGGLGAFSRILPIIDAADIARGVASGERSRNATRLPGGVSQ